MKRFYIVLVVAVVVLQSCTVIKDVTTTDNIVRYDVRLNKVEKPSNAKDRYSEVEIKDKECGVRDNAYEDDIMRIAWVLGKEDFVFSLYNKSRHAIKINWDEAVYVDTDKSVSGVIHKSIKYSQKEESQLPTIIPSGGRIDDVVGPTDKIKGSEYKGWKVLPLLPQSFNTESDRYAIESLKGSEMSVLLPIVVEGVQNDYLFTFKIENAEAYTKENTIQVHDEAEETARAVGLTMLIGVLTTIIVLALSQ